MWTQHINGAIALVKVRGQQQLKDSLSLALFRAVRASMLASSILQDKEIDEFPVPGGWSCDNTLEINAANRLTLICLQLPNMKKYAKKLLSFNKAPEFTTDVMNLIRTAKDVDTQLENWALTLPLEWEFNTAQLCSDTYQTLDQIQNAPFWTGPIHVYHDIAVATIWNDYRLSRIFCQSVVLACVEALPVSHQNAQTARISTSATHIAQEMVNDFCSSVPFLFGYDARNRTQMTGQDEGCKPAPTVPLTIDTLLT